jgi:hypothetical protein
MAVNYQMSLSLSTDYSNFNACSGVENTNHSTKLCLLEDSGLLGCDAVIGKVAPDGSKDCSAFISGSSSPRTMETVHPTTKHHNPSDFNLQ